MLDKRLRRFYQHVVAEVADQGLVTPGQWGPGTPIDYSFARRSWRFGIDRPVAGPVMPEREGDIGPAPLDLGKVTDLNLASAAYLTSDCAYMGELEYGHSQQAPNGMIRTTLNSAQQIVNHVLSMMQKHGT